MKRGFTVAMVVTWSLLAGTAVAKDLLSYIIEMSIEMSCHATVHATDHSSDSTLGDPPPQQDPDARVMRYVMRNGEAVARDIAKRSGEALDALAELMEVPVGDREMFMALLQSHFSDIYRTGKEEPATVVSNIRGVYGKG